MVAGAASTGRGTPHHRARWPGRLTDTTSFHVLVHLGNLAQPAFVYVYHSNKTFTGPPGPPAPPAPRWPPGDHPVTPGHHPVAPGRLPAPGQVGPWSGYFCFVTPSWAALASRYSAVTGAAQLTRLLSRPALTNTALVFAPRSPRQPSSHGAIWNNGGLTTLLFFLLPQQLLSHIRLSQMYKNFMLTFTL